jgi:hypothetical protein
MGRTGGRNGELETNSRVAVFVCHSLQDNSSLPDEDLGLINMLIALNEVNASDSTLTSLT